MSKLILPTKFGPIMTFMLCQEQAGAFMDNFCIQTWEMKQECKAFIGTLQSRLDYIMSFIKDLAEFVEVSAEIDGQELTFDYVV